MTVHKMKNGEYDLHLDFHTLYFIRSLLRNWLDYQKEHQIPFIYRKQKELLEMITTALAPEIEYQELIEQTKCKKFTKLFQGEFLDDNNPEGYKTNKNWMCIDKIKEI